MPPLKKTSSTIQPSGSPKTREEVLAQRRLDSRAEDSRNIKKALKGDQPSYRAILKKYHDQVYNLLYRMVHDKDEVEDLTQEAFIKAFNSLHNFNEEFAFSTWLYKIATNNCIDYIRKKKLATFSIDKPLESKDGEYSFEIPDSSYEPDKTLIAGQRTKILEDAVNALPEKYRQVILMRHTEDKDYQEIADELKLPLGTVKAHIFRAREILYKRLKKKIHQY
ncbi:MAG: sigma-70 family RNA polymerase sigma factor [Bacteroidota bacterium]